MVMDNATLWSTYLRDRKRYLNIVYLAHWPDKSDVSYKFREIYEGDDYRFDEKNLFCSFLFRKNGVITTDLITDCYTSI